MLTRSRRVALSAALCLAAAGCSGDDDGPAADTPGSTATPATETVAPGGVEVIERTPDGARPAPTPGEAVGQLLAAELDGDHARSFALLSTAGREAYPTVAAWVERRTELAQMTAFTSESVAGSVVVIRVDNVPGLDPFKGLSAARERQTWTARPVEEGWLVDPEPAVELLLPPDEDALEATRAWATAVQACDQEAGLDLQAVDVLFGTSQAAGGLCGATGTVEVGAPVALPAGPASTELVAQYSADVALWARAVPVVAPVRFTVVLAPLGDTWVVIALAD